MPSLTIYVELGLEQREDGVFVEYSEAVNMQFSNW
jgi:hypothetical protein